MKTIKNNDVENLDNQKNNGSEVAKISFSSKIWNYIKKHPLSSLLIILLIILTAWLFINNIIIKRSYEKEKTELVTSYENKIDSLIIKNIQSVSTVFSWSVRSELLRENNENLNQLFTVFLKESNINMVQLVQLPGNIITISTDKQYEGKKIEIPEISEIDKQVTLDNENKITVVTPVMGLNTIIGLLVVEIEK